MSTDFSYETPDIDQYKRALIMYLSSKNEEQLVRVVERSKLSIIPSTSFSRRRWNAMWTKIIFYIPMDMFGEIDDPTKEILRNACDTIMPADVGYDVMAVECSIILNDENSEVDLIDDIKKISEKINIATYSFNFPQDILNKGTEMGETYIYLYFVENFIRIFIERICEEKLGSDFIERLALNIKLQNAIKVRKEAEKKNKWISIRGNADLFYLDFRDLGQIIRSNWELFKSYFPDQAWITTKIDELSECRNLVAHNSYIGQHERDVIRVNFNSIVKQLEKHL